MNVCLLVGLLLWSWLEGPHRRWFWCCVFVMMDGGDSCCFSIDLLLLLPKAAGSLRFSGMRSAEAKSSRVRIPLCEYEGQAVAVDCSIQMLRDLPIVGDEGRGRQLLSVLTSRAAV